MTDAEFARRRGEIDRALERLRTAAREHRAAIEELLRLGHIRSRGVVGELGERIAAEYYGVDLAPASTPGYDVVTRDGRQIQVKTLRVTPENLRSSIAPMSGTYHRMLAIRLNEDYTPREAIEVPREVVEEYYGQGRLSWTKTLASDDRVRAISAEELLAGFNG